MLLKGRQALRLVDALSLVAEQNGVAVERNAHFVGVRLAGMRRMRVDLRGGHTGVQRGAHVAQMG